MNAYTTISIYTDMADESYSRHRRIDRTRAFIKSSAFVRRARKSYDDHTTVSARSFLLIQHCCCCAYNTRRIMRWRWTRKRIVYADFSSELSIANFACARVVIRLTGHEKNTSRFRRPRRTDGGEENDCYCKGSIRSAAISEPVTENT